MHALGQFHRYNPRRHENTWPPFCVDDATRARGLYVIGQSGTGKSTLLLNSIMQDIRAGRGCIVIDPKADLARAVLARIPPKRRSDVIYFDPYDLDYPIGFNPLEAVEPRFRSQVAARVLSSFHDLHKNSWGPELANMFRNALHAVLYKADGSLLDVKYILTSREFRAIVSDTITDNLVLKGYWDTDFENFSEKEQRDKPASTLNKIFPFLTDPMLLNIVSQPSAFDFRAIMDTGRIFIANLDQGQLGENCQLIGGLLMSTIHTAAQRRERQDLFPVYVDECQLFNAGSIPEMLSILRSKGVALTLANQYLKQFDEPLRDAILGTVGTVLAFRIGLEDEKTLAPRFRLSKDDEPLSNVPAFRAWVHTPSRTQFLRMPEAQWKTYPAGEARIRNHTRATYAKPRSVIEARISAFVAAISDAF